MLNLSEVNFIKSTVVNCTEECFSLRVEHDDAGSHYSLYVIGENFNSKTFWKKINGVSLSKRLIIMLINNDTFIKNKETI